MSGAPLVTQVENVIKQATGLKTYFQYPSEQYHITATGQKMTIRKITLFDVQFHNKVDAHAFVTNLGSILPAEVLAQIFPLAGGGFSVHFTV